LAKVRDDGSGMPGARARKASRAHAAGSPTPRHSVRATRNAGQSMRSRLLDAASELFKAHGLNGTSITAIAGASDAFPSQITYYFRTKEALFVEAACRDILHIAERAEKAAARARTPKAYASAVVDSVVGADGLVLFVEALTLARQRPDLVPQIARTIERLHVEAARAYGREMARHGWHTHHAPDVTARKFWTIALGIALEGHAMGRSVAAMGEAMREALGELAQVRPARSAAAPALRIVTAPGRPSARST
jgi:AcrR family transcriptional regulator